MNNSSILQSKWSPKGITLTLQETQSIHDSKNRPKIEFIAYIYILLLLTNISLYIRYIYNIGNKTVLYFICTRITVFVGVLNEKAEQPCEHRQPKQEACFARANQVLLVINHNTGVTSGECMRCS